MLHDLFAPDVALCVSSNFFTILQRLPGNMNYFIRFQRRILTITFVPGALFQILFIIFSLYTFLANAYLTPPHTLGTATHSCIFKFRRKFNFYQESLRFFAYRLLQYSICSLIECIKEIHLNCMYVNVAMPAQKPRATENIPGEKSQQSSINQQQTNNNYG